MAYALDQYNTVAAEYKESAVYTGLFPKTTLFSLMFGRDQRDSDLKPGLSNIIGDKRSLESLPPALRASIKEELKGSTFHDVPIQHADMGGATGVGYRGSSSATTNEDLYGSLVFPWSFYTAPIKIWKDDLDAAQGEYKRLNLVKGAVQTAINSLGELVASAIYTGNPTQTEKQMDAFIGMDVALDDGVTHTTYGRVDKTAETMIKPALYDGALRDFSWDLIDEVNAGSTHPKGGAGDLGNGVDVVIVNKSLFYGSVKPLARAESMQIINAGEGLPEMGLIGFKREAVMYGNTLITFDPYCPAGLTGLSKMYSLVLGSWVVEIHPDYDFNITKLVDQSEQNPDGDRALTANVELKARVICREPWLNGLHADVS